MIEKVAEPTVGRIVYFYEPLALHPLPAMVVAVIAGGHTIPALHVFRLDGAESVENVPHVQDQVANKPWWDWMPYQKGQAAKTEALQAELDKNLASTRTYPLPYDNELSKTQSSTPSPEDGKR